MKRNLSQDPVFHLSQQFVNKKPMKKTLPTDQTFSKILACEVFSAQAFLGIWKQGERLIQRRQKSIKQQMVRANEPKYYDPNNQQQHSHRSPPQK